MLTVAGAAIFADGGFDGQSRGHHAASRWVVELPLNSPMREVTPAIRSLMSTQSALTSTRSTSSWTMQACSVGKSWFQSGSRVGTGYLRAGFLDADRAT
jgi:hypothetical protein